MMSCCYRLCVRTSLMSVGVYIYILDCWTLFYFSLNPVFISVLYLCQHYMKFTS